jgi:iron complex outermembrane receptor protein
VTATREARSLTQVPFAVSVVNSVQWRNRSGYGLDQALALVPGVLAQSRYGTHDIRLVIRGFGVRGAGDRSNAGTARGIRVVLDGIPETEPDGRTAFDHVDMATIERVEVLRSNGSAAWGNAGGGVVSLSSAPDFDGHMVEVSQQGGSFGLLRTALRGGLGVGNGKVWLAFTRSIFDGWRQHSDASRSMLVGGASTPLANSARLGISLAGASNLFRIPGPLSPSQFASDPRRANSVYLQRDERRFNRLARLGVTYDQGLGTAQDLSLMLFLNPKYLQRSERGTYRDFTRYHIGGSAAWGTRFSLGEVEHRLRVGGDAAYQDGAILFYNLGPGATRGTTLTTNKREGAQNAGAYLQDEFQVGRWRVLLGVRYDDLAYFYADRFNPAIDASKRFRRLSPRGGVSYQFAPGSSFYASYGAGVEIPAGNETDPPPGIPNTATAINPLLDPILSGTVEAGVRRYVSFQSRILRNLAVDAALYSIRVNGEPVPYSSGRFYLTAGEVTRRGLELGLLADFAAGLSARFAGTFSRNTYDRYRVDSTYLGAPGRIAVLDGNSVAGLPPRIVNASLGWKPQAAPQLGLEVGVQHLSDYFADDRNVVKVPSFTVWRASASLEGHMGGAQARFYLSVENLTNRKYVGSAFVNPDYSGGQPLVYEAGLPRSLLLGVTLRQER